LTGRLEGSEALLDAVHGSDVETVPGGEAR